MIQGKRSSPKEIVENMKITVVWPSPNKDGLTVTAAKQFMKGLHNAGIDIHEIWLNREKIEHCRACGNGWGACRKAGEVYYDKLKNGFDMYY